MLESAESVILVVFAPVECRVSSDPVAYREIMHIGSHSLDRAGERCTNDCRVWQGKGGKKGDVAINVVQRNTRIL
jgi:hypothetical protein